MFLSKKSVLLPCFALSLTVFSAFAVNNPQPGLQFPEFQSQVGPQALPIQPALPTPLTWGEWLDEASFYVVPVLSVAIGALDAITMNPPYTSTPARIAARVGSGVCIAFLAATGLAVGSRFIVIACGGGKH